MNGQRRTPYVTKKHETAFTTRIPKVDSKSKRVDRPNTERSRNVRARRKNLILKKRRTRQFIFVRSSNYIYIYERNYSTSNCFDSAFPIFARPFDDISTVGRFVAERFLIISRKSRSFREFERKVGLTSVQ